MQCIYCVNLSIQLYIYRVYRERESVEHQHPSQEHWTTEDDAVDMRPRRVSRRVACAARAGRDKIVKSCLTEFDMHEMDDMGVNVHRETPFLALGWVDSISRTFQGVPRLGLLI